MIECLGSRICNGFSCLAERPSRASRPFFSPLLSQSEFVKQDFLPSFLSPFLPSFLPGPAHLYIVMHAPAGTEPKSENSTSRHSIANCLVLSPFILNNDIFLVNCILAYSSLCYQNINVTLLTEQAKLTWQLIVNDCRLYIEFFNGTSVTV